MSEHTQDKPQAAQKVRADKGGGGARWLIGAAVAAAVVLAGGYAMWTMWGPTPNDSVETAANDPYASEPLSALAPDAGPDASASDDSVAAPAASEPAPTPARRRAPRPEEVPEATIGVTPANANAEETLQSGGDDIVITARRPIWASTPSARRLSALYPERALERGREGEARLACVVQERGVLDCERIEETRAEFGAAALRVARTFRHSTTLADGGNAVGTPVNLRVVFRIAEDERRS